MKEPMAASAHPTSPEGKPPTLPPNGDTVGDGSVPLCVASEIDEMNRSTPDANIANPSTVKAKPSQISQRAFVLVAATCRRKLSRCCVMY